MLKCFLIFCSGLLNVNTPKFHNMNFPAAFANFLITLELFTVTPSFPVYSTYSPTFRLDIELFFQLKSGAKVRWFFYPENLPFLG